MKIKIINKSRHKLPANENFLIRDGKRSCQMIIAKHQRAERIKIEELIETERGSGGFGHTGRH